VGLDNFRRIITDDPFRQTFSNNVKFTPAVLVGQTVLSLLLALMSSKNTRANIFYRVSTSSPTVISSVSVASPGY